MRRGRSRQENKRNKKPTQAKNADPTESDRRARVWFYRTLLTRTGIHYARKLF